MLTIITILGQIKKYLWFRSPDRPYFLPPTLNFFFANFQIFPEFSPLSVIGSNTRFSFSNDGLQLVWEHFNSYQLIEKKINQELFVPFVPHNK